VGKGGEVGTGCLPFGKYKGVKIEKLPFGYVDFLLTKTDIKNKEESREIASKLQDVWDDYVSQFEDDPSSIVLAFGKYEGMELEAIPSDYLQWLLDQAWFRDNILHKYVQKYLDESRE